MLGFSLTMFVLPAAIVLLVLVLAWLARRREG